MSEKLTIGLRHLGGTISKILIEYSMGRSGKVGHDKPLIGFICFAPLLGTKDKIRFLILVYFFLKKSHPRKRIRTPLSQDGKPTPDRTVPSPFFRANRIPN